MFHYRATIAYKGTHFRGWQVQSAGPDLEGAPTIQGTIHQALRKIARYQECAIVGCSRTDAGVHARGQVGKISIPKDIEPALLLRGLNSSLPDDIRILTCDSCEPSFNPQVGATSKEYHYYFSRDPVAIPVLSDFVAHVPGPLNLERMEQAARLFVGEHDFVNFYRRSSLAATTTRTIYACEIRASDFSGLAGELHYIRVVGSGFLKQMIRYMAGTLFEVGKSRVTLPALAQHLRVPCDDKLSAKASARGLHLLAIEGL